MKYLLIIAVMTAVVLTGCSQKYVKQIDDLSAKLLGAERELAALNDTIELEKQTIAKLQDDISQLKNPSTKEIDFLTGKIEEQKKIIADLQKKLAKLQSDYDALRGKYLAPGELK